MDMEAKKKSGSDKRKRQPHIDFRVTEEEREKITRAAARAGLDVGAYVRAQALGEPVVRAARHPVISSGPLVRLVAALGKVGSNLNQLAHVANREGRIIEGEVKATLTELRGVLDVALRVLGRRAGNYN